MSLSNFDTTRSVLVVDRTIFVTGNSYCKIQVEQEIANASVGQNYMAVSFVTSSSFDIDVYDINDCSLFGSYSRPQIQLIGINFFQIQPCKGRMNIYDQHEAYDFVLQIGC